MKYLFFFFFWYILVLHWQRAVGNLIQFSSYGVDQSNLLAAHITQVPRQAPGVPIITLTKISQRRSRKMSPVEHFARNTNTSPKENYVQEIQSNFLGKKGIITLKIKFSQWKLGIVHHQFQSVHSVNQHKFGENDVAISATTWKQNNNNNVSPCLLAKYKNLGLRF